MTGVTEARRAMLVVAHHSKKLEDDFLVDALLRLRSPLWTPQFTAERVREARTLRQLKGGFSLVYPHPAPTYPGHEAGLSVVVRQSEGFQLSNSRQARLEPLVDAPENWVRVDANYKRLSHASQLDVDWFIEKVHNFLPAFEPDFVCGDADVAVAKYFGERPAETVWPLAYYGPSRVAELGRDRLLKAPAWEVKQDERGGIWIQARENPFTTTPADLKELAAHLGLKARK